MVRDSAAARSLRCCSKVKELLLFIFDGSCVNSREELVDALTRDSRHANRLQQQTVSTHSLRDGDQQARISLQKSQNMRLLAPSHLERVVEPLEHEAHTLSVL